jgi:hypothetical protein
VFVYYLWDAQTNCAANLVRTDGTNRPAYVDYRNRATGTSDRLNPISLRAANGKFVTADLGGNGKVMADRVAAGSWETFDLLDLNGGGLIDGDSVAIQTASGAKLARVLHERSDRGHRRDHRGPDDGRIVGDISPGVTLAARKRRLQLIRGAEFR